MSAAPVYYRQATRQSRRRFTSPQSPRRRRRPNTATKVVAFFLCFASSAVVAFGFSTLLGCSFQETAKRDALRAAGKAKQARADVARFKLKGDRLVTLKEVDLWAQENGFVPSYQNATEKVVKPVKQSEESLVAVNSAKPKIELTLAEVGNVR